MAVWYPTLAALEDLVVTENEGGFEFSAPEGTECATWLGYYNSTDELRKEFNIAIVTSIADHIKELEKNGSKK